jgi:hypothetical protein
MLAQVYVRSVGKSWSIIVYALQTIFNLCIPKKDLDKPIVHIEHGGLT